MTPTQRIRKTGKCHHKGCHHKHTAFLALIGYASDQKSWRVVCAHHCNTATQANSRVKVIGHVATRDL